MKMNLYVIRDVVAGESGPVFEAKNDGVARRQFDKLLQDNDSMDESEFMLVCVGDINHESDIVHPMVKDINPDVVLDEVEV